MRISMRSVKKRIFLLLAFSLLMSGSISDRVLAAQARQNNRTIRDVETRTTKPTEDNNYFYDWNVYYQSGYGIPNCTCYAYGRAYEVLGTRPKLCTGDAASYYAYNKIFGPYDYGQVPKAGSIGVFGGGIAGDGHVIFVERVNQDGTIDVTDSNYIYSGGYDESLAFRYITNITPETRWPHLNFLGYIYVAADDSDKSTGVVGNSDKSLSKEAYFGYKIMDLNSGVSFGFLDRKEENNRLE